MQIIPHCPIRVDPYNLTLSEVGERADALLQLTNLTKRYVLIIEVRPDSPGMWDELISSSEFNYGYLAMHSRVESLWP